MATKPRIAIVGPGRLGTALAVALARAGFRISEVITRDSKASLVRARSLARRVRAPARLLSGAQLDGDVVWLCVPDGQIAVAARELASQTGWNKRLAFHSSGALASDELDILRQRGAKVASVHPLMTFVAGSMPSLEGVPFAVEGDAAAVREARRIVRELGGETFLLRKADKAAYHAWGTFASPLFLAALVTAEQAARASGFPAASARRKMLPILQQTLRNYAMLGPGASFSGPLVRGDVEIVRQHLTALRKAPEIREVYVALAGAALKFLPVRNRGELAKVLGKSSPLNKRLPAKG